MDNQFLYSTIKKYYSKLANTGKTDKLLTERILMLEFATSYLEGDLSAFLTEDDLNTIEDFMYSLFGLECLIGYPESLDKLSANSSKNIIVSSSTVRSTNKCIVRVSSDNSVRSV